MLRSETKVGLHNDIFKTTVHNQVQCDAVMLLDKKIDFTHSIVKTTITPN